MPDRSRSQRTALLALVLGVAVLVLHARIVLGGQTWDDVRYHTHVVPPRLATAHAVLAGEAPTWWDGSGLGVPLFAEPSHGAAYPLIGLAHSQHALDLLAVLHLFWLALGVALWSRRLGASELACVVAGVLAAASGIALGAALRGALPALAHVPWVGWAAHSLASAESSARARRAAALLGLALGAIGLAGQLAILVDALVLAALCATGSRGSAREIAGARGSNGDASANVKWLVAAIAGGLAIAAALWLPALAIAGDGVGATVGPMKLSRLLELVVPGSFGSSTGEHAVPALAGTSPALPSLLLGAPAFALAVLARPAWRVVASVAVCALLALVVGRGGAWPALLGLPELHLAMLAMIVLAHAGPGVDVLVTGDRRALRAVAGAAVVSALSLVAVAMLRSRTDSAALDRALLEGGLGVGCIVGAFVIAWRGSASWSALAIAALLVAPSVGSLGSTAPTIPRDLVDTPPLWAASAHKAQDPTNPAAPLRLYRPISFYEDEPEPRVADAIATLVGAAPARYGLDAARSEDPARPPVHDQLWLASAAAGGAFLERYGIQLAILPGSMVQGHGLVELARRGNWILAQYPASPPASMVFEWLWLADDTAALARLFPPGGHGLPRGLVVLHGTGAAQQEEPRPPEPCTITRWARGAIDLTCAAQEPSYAVVSSTSARGWTVEVDGKPTPWVTADLMRRAVALPPGAHVVSWRYEAPGFIPGIVIAALGLIGLLAMLIVRVPREPAPDEN